MPGIPDATALLEDFGSGALSPLEALDAALERIARTDPAVNAFCLVDADRAREAAAASEARWSRGEPAGLLDGVPVVDQGHAPDEGLADAARLEDGRSERDRGTTTRRRSRGCASTARCCSARRRRRSSAGRASPTARSPASRAIRGTRRRRRAAPPAAPPRRSPPAWAPLALGTDGGGSIRIPCGFTGLFGIKPTFGRVPAWPLSPVRHGRARRPDDADGAPTPRCC